MQSMWFKRETWIFIGWNTRMYHFDLASVEKLWYDNILKHVELVPNHEKFNADQRRALEYVVFAMNGSKHIKISCRNQGRQSWWLINSELPTSGLPTSRQSWGRQYKVLPFLDIFSMRTFLFLKLADKTILKDNRMTIPVDTKCRARVLGQNPITS